MNPVTSSSATGSFMPDSPSSARASGRRRREPRRTAKIAALSVAATAEPIDQPLERREVEEPGRDDAGDHGGDHGADRRQRDRGPEHRADLAPAGGQPALEQDQDQADRPQGPGQLGVVELDPADPLGADQHPEAEEEEQAGDADPVGHLGGGDPGREQEAGDQDQVGVAHRPVRTPRRRSRAAPRSPRPSRVAGRRGCRRRD